MIRDGDGRWAEARGLDGNEGHWAGLESVRAVVRAAHESGIGVLTLFAFSSENWSRPKGEVQELTRLLDHYIEEELDAVMRNAIRVLRIRLIGSAPPIVPRNGNRRRKDPLDPGRAYFPRSHFANARH